MVTVSVIIPCYNHGRYVADAVQSALDQTFTDLEIIVVDDGSTDNTRAVVQSFTDNRLRYIHQPNRGRSSARNTGIRAATGKLITFLDADDWFMPRKLELQVRLLTLLHEFGLVAGGWIETDESGNALVEQRMWEACPSLAVETWLFACPVTPSSVLVRKEWLEKVGLFDENLNRVEDWDLWLRLALAGCLMIWDPRIVTRYRMHGENSVRDVELMGASTFQMFDKLFANPSLPAEIRQLRRAVYGHAHLQTAARAYAARRFELAKKELALAIALKPQLVQGQPQLPRLIQEFRYWSRSPLAGPAEQYLEGICRHLPGSARAARGPLQRVLAEELINKAFISHHEGRSREARPLIAKAVRYDPRLLTNMGVLSMMVESYFGSRFAQRCRSVARRIILPLLARRQAEPRLPGDRGGGMLSG